MLEAQRRAQAPFEGELRAIELALGAIERAGLEERRVPAERASFASPTPGRRGRRSRSVADMILMVLDRGGSGLCAADIAQQLDRRWNKSVPVAAVMLELQNLQSAGAVAKSQNGWTRGLAASPEGDDDHVDEDDAKVA